MSTKTTRIATVARDRVAGPRQRDWAVIAAAVLLTLVVLTALVSPLLIGPASTQSILDALLPPGSPGHLLGTDELGRDVLLLAENPEFAPIVVDPRRGFAIEGVGVGLIRANRGW